MMITGKLPLAKPGATERPFVSLGKQLINSTPYLNKPSLQDLELN